MTCAAFHHPFTRALPPNNVFRVIRSPQGKIMLPPDLFPGSWGVSALQACEATTRSPSGVHPQARPSIVSDHTHQQVIVPMSCCFESNTNRRPKLISPLPWGGHCTPFPASAWLAQPSAAPYPVNPKPTGPISPRRGRHGLKSRVLSLLGLYLRPSPLDA